MSVFKIEQGVAIPPDTWGEAGAKYPFGKMAVGDSFFVPAEQMKKVRGAAHSYGKRKSMKFRVRAEGDGFRVWRVA